MSFRLAPVTVVAVLVALDPAQDGPPGPRAWVPTVPGTTPPLADAMARVPRGAPPEETGVAHLYAARGEAEGFPVVVRAPAGSPITSLRVGASALTCTSGACSGRTIPVEYVEVYRAMYQEVRVPTGPGRRAFRYYRPSRPLGPAGSGTLADPGMGSMCGAGRPYGPAPCYIPDGLVPYKICRDGSAPPCPGDPGRLNPCPVDGTGCGLRPPPMTVSSEACGGPCNQELWIEITVPRGARRTPGGVYDGAVTVVADGAPVRIGVRLHVWDFELPLAPSFRTGFGSNTAPTRGGRGWVVREQDYLAKHRISTVHYGTFDDGYSRAWALKKAWGVPNAAGAGFWPGVSGSRCDRQAPYPSRREVERWLSSRAVPRDVTIYITDGDEIWRDQQARCDGSLYGAIRAGARVAHAAGVKVQSTVNPLQELSYQNEDGTGPPAVDVFVAGPEQMFRESPRNRLRRPDDADVVKKVLEAGSELWTYNIWLGNSFGPKWQLDYSPVSYRMGFIAQALGISGAWISEYWTGATARDDPWVNGVHSCLGSDDSCPMNGDSQFIYPGAPVGMGATPVPILRLKFLRDGIDDYELIRILRTISGGAGYDTGSCPGFPVSCRDLVRSLGGTDYSDYSTDTHALQRARKAIGDRIAADPDRPRGEP